MEYVTNTLSGSVQQTCAAALSEDAENEDNEDYTLTCSCWTALDQTFLYDNFDCLWESDNSRTLLQTYLEECFTTEARNHQINIFIEQFPQFDESRINPSLLLS